MKTTREIDQKAQDIFRITLPPAWLKREQHPDIHIDYFVETTSGSEPSGLVFGVQLKGTKRTNLSKNSIKYSLKTKHLKYYVDKVRQPVFLIVIDVIKKEGFWVFLQKWAKEELKDRNWRDQKNITIKISTVNSLADLKTFQAKIIEADAYMRELWPSSVNSAVAFEKASWEKLDPRIAISISLQDGKPHYFLSAKESFEFQFQFKDSPEFRRKYSNLIESGKELSIGIEELYGVIGSPLLEKIFLQAERGKLKIQPGTVFNANITLVTTDASNNKYPLYGITGIMSGGKKAINFQGNLPNSPLKVGLLLSDGLSSLKIKVSFGLDFKSWGKQPLQNLAYFEKIKKIFGNLQENPFLEISCEIDGNPIFSGTANLPEAILKKMSHFLEYFAFIEKTRAISKVVGINPKFPMGAEISREDENTVLILYELTQGREFRQEAYSNKGTINLEGNAKEWEKIFRKLNGSNNEQLVIEEEARIFNLLGESFKFGPLRTTISNIKINLEEFLKMIPKNDSEIRREDVEWESGAESVLTISKL